MALVLSRVITRSISQLHSGRFAEDRILVQSILRYLITDMRGGLGAGTTAGDLEYTLHIRL